MATDIDPCRSTTTLENEKFATNANGKTVVRVEDETSGSADPLNGLDWDAFLITDNTLNDVVQYYSGGLVGTVLATFTATYTGPRKKTLVSGVWTYP